MIFYDFDDRLIATDEGGTKGAAWSSNGSWNAISPEFAGRVWVEGEQLTPATAAKRFPSADLKAVAIK